ncbi:esterase [Acrasis kona]|uniref:Esterase n=1 Tax=Acrasis kona TaxID=1008807 RepID=A0AAW2ZGW2_9EUKA
MKTIEADIYKAVVAVLTIPRAVIRFYTSIIHAIIFLILKKSFDFFYGLFCIGLRFIPYEPKTSPEGRAFMDMIRFTEFIGAKFSIRNSELNKPIPPTRDEKIHHLSVKLAELFDWNLHFCYPTNVVPRKFMRVDKINLFDEESFDDFGRREETYLIRATKQSNTARTCILYFHGGGFMSGETRTYVNILTPWLHENNLDCLLVDYSMNKTDLPEVLLRQGLQSYFYLLQTFPPSTNIVLMGESAGANLAIQVALNYNKQFTERRPDCMVLLSPWVDLTLQTHSWKESNKVDVVLSDNVCRLGDKLEIYTKEESRKLSPLHTDLSHLPPSFVAYGKHERLHDEGFLLCDKLRKCGVVIEEEPFEGMFHAFSLFHSYVPEGKLSLKNAASFINKHIPSS